MAQISELVFLQNSSSGVLFCFAYLDQPFMRTNHVNFVFFTAKYLFDTYFDDTAMTGNMQLYLGSAQNSTD